MKVFAKILGVSALLALMAGCASSVYVPRIPQGAQAHLLDYHKQPDNKVFVIAIDAGGDYAFGYDYGKPTTKEAAKAAVEKCDANRKASGVVAKPYIYAVNDKVVYETMIRKAAKAESEAKSREVQHDAVQE